MKSLELRLRKKSPSFLKSGIVVSSPHEFLEWTVPLYQYSVPVIGFDTEYGIGREVPMRGKDRVYQDYKSLIPHSIQFNAKCCGEEGTFDHSVFVKIGNVEANSVLIRCLDKFLREPFTFSCHWQTAESSCLDALGLAMPRNIHDSYAAERFMTIGMDQRSAKPKEEGDSDEFEAQRVKKKVDLSLTAVAEKYGVKHAYAEEKASIQKKFASADLLTDLTERDISYAIEDARVSSEVYGPQTMELMQRGQLYPFVRFYGSACSVLTEMS